MQASYEVISLETVDSTSRYLKDYVTENRPIKPIFCTTKIQTSGYGQQKRRWVTNQDSAIFSLAYPLEAGFELSGLLSLHIAALLHQSLNELTTAPLYLKWPNDIFNDQGKVAGMLIEQVLKKDYRALIIGIGINRGRSGVIDGSSSVEPFDLDALFERFFHKIQQAGLQNYSQLELNEHWQAHDLFEVNETVRFISPEKETTGLYLGINSEGQALIEVRGEIRVLSSGLTSIRKHL
ncbi:biotin--[acetyl-CoA-carboxylase] ligase [Thiomicrorhabdus arctica]|jgi:biotin-[acetyl-CoA-carboxylase] ligase BirA-like protein|uniref:biotin--[acetyl-CoA-carboxylase] ligase n=1 Tax=Thiomicrorhabdus arctica TaxID=131540 RepID=UPI00037B9F77|nr:biotin--[acetyl-CoA-carboxylase] ligase [Thiomicrorhabdus arctica]